MQLHRITKAQTLAQKLQEKYDTQVIPTDCENLTADKIDEIFGKVLYKRNNKSKI